VAAVPAEDDVVRRHHQGLQEALFTDAVGQGDDLGVFGVDRAVELFVFGGGVEVPERNSDKSGFA
jgi:hypothetical protein